MRLKRHWTNLDSIHILRCAYDSEPEILLVVFNGEQKYKYFNVPHVIYAGLCETNDPQTYFKTVIKKGLKPKCERVLLEDEG